MSIISMLWNVSNLCHAIENYSAQSSLSNFAKSTYLCIYEDSYGMKLLKEDCTHIVMFLAWIAELLG